MPLLLGTNAGRGEHAAGHVREAQRWGVDRVNGTWPSGVRKSRFRLFDAQNQQEGAAILFALALCSAQPRQLVQGPVEGIRISILELQLEHEARLALDDLVCPYATQADGKVAAPLFVSQVAWRNRSVRGVLQHPEIALKVFFHDFLQLILTYDLVSSRPAHLDRLKTSPIDVALKATCEPSRDMLLIVLCHVR